MRLVLISDIHDAHPAVPEGDVLCLVGDIFCGDDAASLRSDLTWVKSLGFERVIAVLGNHDLNLRHLLKTNLNRAADLLKESGVALLQDSETTINGVTVYGVAWGSREPIPPADVVLTHAPVAGILDQRQPPKSEHLGDIRLAKQINSGHRLVACGHIHGGYGRVERDGTTFINCSLVNESRQQVNAPWVYELEAL